MEKPIHHYCPLEAGSGSASSFAKARVGNPDLTLAQPYWGLLGPRL